MALLRLSCTPYRSLRLGAASAGNSSFRPICGSRLFPAGDILKAPGSTSLSQTISLLCSTSRLIQRHNLLQHLRHPALPAARLLATAASDQPARTPQPQAVPNSRNEWTEEAEASIEEKGEHRQWAGGGGYVHTSAQVHPSVRVEPAAVVQAGASIGPGSVIGAGSVVGPGVTVGSATTLGPLVTLQHCTVGDRCTLHSGVRVGQDGFGFFVNECGEMVKKPQILAVRIGHDVEIGANSCIDRGSWRDTVIGDHCKLDNLVQIGHNVVLGRCCILCGQAGRLRGPGRASRGGRPRLHPFQGARSGQERSHGQHQRARGLRRIPGSPGQRVEEGGCLAEETGSILHRRVRVEREEEGSCPFDCVPRASSHLNASVRRWQLLLRCELVFLVVDVPP